MFEKPERRMQCLSLGNAELSGWDILYTSIPHQATFFKNLCSCKIKYDESFLIWSDLNLCFSLYYLQGASISYYNQIDIACFDTTGVSQTPSPIIGEEREHIRHIYLTNSQFNFYNSSFNSINLDIRHNYKTIGWVVSVFVFISKIFGYKSIDITLEKGNLPLELIERDIEYCKKNETIRQCRLFWKTYNLVFSAIFGLHRLFLPSVKFR